jgi:ssDNA-binding Zn-finger/Zn-ribbon topoisomerase 1
MKIKNAVTNISPICPKCGGNMHINHPRQWQDWDSFWSCNGYPGCKGTYNISRIDGRPIVLEDNAPEWASRQWDEN